MRRSTSILVLYLSAVFLSGIVVGAVGHKLYTAETMVRATDSRRPSPEEWRREYIQTMTTRLDLSSRQIDQLNAVLDLARDRFVALDKEVIRPQQHAIRADQNEAIKSILTEAQQAEYAKMQQEWSEHRRRWAEQKDHDRHPKGE